VGPVEGRPRRGARRSPGNRTPWSSPLLPRRRSALGPLPLHRRSQALRRRHPFGAACCRQNRGLDEELVGGATPPPQVAGSPPFAGSRWDPPAGGAERMVGCWRSLHRWKEKETQGKQLWFARDKVKWAHALVVCCGE
jgi:hypothetical protein